ncbi:MAG: Gfo/Idh/MocA family oxidoreductase [Planctomycetes bacterium]|nr:Gfo/Idh/MocA family oxidoreductase [Planctomycetota bacterium]
MNAGVGERFAALRQRWPTPSKPAGIVLIGAGGIVNDAHLPAYRAGGLPVAGVFDVDRARARATAERWGIARVFEHFDQACADPRAVFDVAVPPQALFEVVSRLPEGSAALLQKPMGVDLADATRIRDACRSRALRAAVNLQLRFAPSMLALADALAQGLLGRVVELEVHVNCRMPWELWPFLESLERMEIALHSIHYLDTIRALLGEPRAVYGRTVKHPDAARLASSRTTAILDYADDVRCALSVNHHHKHGVKHQSSQLRVEGTRGAALVVMGVNLDYPRGRPDELEIALDGHEWSRVALQGHWFPDAFLARMNQLQRHVCGDERELVGSTDDAWRTMALVEALYRSSASGGTPVPREEHP